MNSKIFKISIFFVQNSFLTKKSCTKFLEHDFVPIFYRARIVKSCTNREIVHESWNRARLFSWFRTLAEIVIFEWNSRKWSSYATPRFGCNIRKSTLYMICVIFARKCHFEAWLLRWLFSWWIWKIIFFVSFGVPQLNPNFNFAIFPQKWRFRPWISS